MLAYPAVNIDLDARADKRAVSSLVAAFAAAGVRADVTASHSRKGFTSLPWEALILAPVGAFFTALSAEAGKDAWRLLKQLVLRVHAARRSAGAGPGAVYLGEHRSGGTIVTTEDLPDEAWQQLLDLPAAQLRSGAWRWSHDEGRWLPIE